MEAGIKLISQLANPSLQMVMKSGEWGELRQLIMRDIMGSRAQFKVQRTPVSRSVSGFSLGETFLVLSLLLLPVLVLDQDIKSRYLCPYILCCSSYEINLGDRDYPPQSMFFLILDVYIVRRNFILETLRVRIYLTRFIISL